MSENEMYAVGHTAIMVTRETRYYSSFPIVGTTAERVVLPYAKDHLDIPTAYMLKAYIGYILDQDNLQLPDGSTIVMLTKSEQVKEYMRVLVIPVKGPNLLLPPSYDTNVAIDFLFEDSGWTRITRR